MDDRTMQQQVAFLVRCLLEERKRTGGWLPPREPGADEPFGEQWDVFRALVNTREPYPAPEGFLAAQDALLRGARSACRRHAGGRPAACCRGRAALALARRHHDARCRRHRERGQRADVGLLGSRPLLHRQRHPHLCRRAASPGVRTPDGRAGLRRADGPRQSDARLQPAVALRHPYGRAHRRRALNRPAPSRVWPRATGAAWKRRSPARRARSRSAASAPACSASRRKRLRRWPCARCAHGWTPIRTPDLRVVFDVFGERDEGSLSRPAVLTKAPSASWRRCSRKAGSARTGRRRG